MPQKVECVLKCSSCNDEHTHIFYEPVPDDFDTECRTCETFCNHNIIESTKI